MRNLILFLFAILLFSSCEPVPFEVEDQHKSTTIEIQNLIEKDTILYKVIEIDHDLYIVNNNTNLVEYKAANEADGNSKALFIFIVMSILILIFFILLTTD